MNRLVLIGNGFDLAHGLKTSYADFVDWYFEKRYDNLLDTHNDVSEDSLLTILIFLIRFVIIKRLQTLVKGKEWSG